MSNLKLLDPVWGEDLVALRQKGGEIAEDAESRILSKYMLEIRKRLETDKEARQTAADAKPAMEAKDELMRIFALANMISPGTEDLCEKALTEILYELDHIRETGAGLMLIDAKTGKAVLPLTPDMIYTPPDSIGEDGKLRKSAPILHPGISASLGMKIQDEARHIELLRKASKARDAYAHITDPGKITELAKERLQNLNITIVDSLPGVESVTLEFGREQVSGIEQSPNLHFHRAYMYAAVLATKILKACGSYGVCSFGPIQLLKNSKQRWYTIDVKTQIAS